MPAYTLTSPNTGRTYDVEIDHAPGVTPPDSAFAEIGQQLDARVAQQEQQRPFLRVGDTLNAVGDALGGLPTTLTSSFYRLKEGDKRPDQYSPAARAAFDAEKQYTQDIAQEEQNRLLAGESSSAGSALRNVGPSLGFSGVTMASSMLGNALGRPIGALIGGAGGAPTGPGAVATAGVGATAGGVVGGMALSGAAAYRMAANQFLDEAWNRVGEERQKKGLSWNETDKAQAYKELLPLAQNSGLWEAGPEAIGNAFGMAAGKYILGVGKKAATELAESIYKTVGKKAAAFAGGTGMELATETATQIGQGPAQAQAQALAAGNPNWQQEAGPYAGPGGTLQALKDVGPVTVAQSALMLGLGGAVKGVGKLFPQRNELPTNQTPGAPAGAAASAPVGGVAATTDAPEGHAGDLTLTEVQDLETGRPEDVQDPASSIQPPASRPQPNWSWQGFNQSGQDISGTVAGATEQEAIAAIRAQGHYPVHITPASSIEQPASRPQPILTNVPEAGGVEQTMSDSAAPDNGPAQTITGFNVQTGTEMPVPPPTADAGAGAGATVAEPLMSPAANRLGRGLADLMPQRQDGEKRRGGDAENPAVSQSPSLPVSQSPSLPISLSSAYQRAARGQSSAMIPLADVFAEAQKDNPALTREQFAAQVKQDYEAGTLMLEGANSQAEADAAGLRIDSTPVGSAVRLAVVPGLQSPAGSSNAGGMASDSGAAQSNEPSPGGLTDWRQVTWIKLPKATRDVWGYNDRGKALLTVEYPKGWKLVDFTDSKGGSVYYTFETISGKRLRVSLRDHSISPFRAQEFGQVDLSVRVKDSKSNSASKLREYAGEVTNALWKWLKENPAEYQTSAHATSATAGSSMISGTDQNPTTATPVNPESSRAESGMPGVASPAQIAADQARNESVLKELGLPTKAGSRIWGKKPVAEALRKIAADASQPATMRFMARLLGRMDLGNLLLRIESDGRLSYAGQYQPMGNGRGEIALNTRVLSRGLNAGQGDVRESLVHEVLHHVTYNVLRNPKTAAQKAAKAALETLRKRALSALAVQEQAGQFDYELSNLDEFISALFTRADFQTALAGIPAEQAPKSLGQRARSMLDEIFRTLAELVTGKPVPEGSVIEASFANALRLIEEPGTGGGLRQGDLETGRLGDEALQSPAFTGSRLASPDEAQNVYDPITTAQMQANANAWLDANGLEAGVVAMEQNAAAGLEIQNMPALGAEVITRLTALADNGNEVDSMQANTLLDRASRAWHGRASQQAGQTQQQRAAATNVLLPIMPVLTAKELLVDRGKRIVKERFEGGEEGVTEKVKVILTNAELDITERVERILQAVMGSRLRPRVSIAEAVAGLLNGKTQREQMIDDVARALMQRAKSRQVKPGTQTALAALVASLKRTLGAAVKGKALKPDALPMGELLARTFVDQVAEAPMFAEAWQAGRQQVLAMLQELGMTDTQAQARLNQLMPPTPTVAYAPGMVKQAIQRGFEAAGYGRTLTTGMQQTGERTLDVRAEALRDPAKAKAAVLAVWDAEAQAAGISAEAWAQGRVLAEQALNETLAEWQKQAADAQAKQADEAKARLMAKDSPALAKLLRTLKDKIAPGMSWADIFMDMPDAQKERQREIYRRLMLDERLKALTPEERVALTNELDKAWQRERQKVFKQELQKAGVLGEKAATDRKKVEKALPKLLRLLNLGMMNSEMFREAIAPEYGVKTMTAEEGKRLRDLFNAAYKLPKGVRQNEALMKGLVALQRITGVSKVDMLNNFWVASVLSGPQTLFDTLTTAASGGLFDTFTSALGLAMKGNPQAGLTALAEWWRTLPQAMREAGRILGKGELFYLRQFADESKRGLEGLGIASAVSGERLLSEPELSKKALGLLLAWTGRSMAAFDHLTNTTTKAGHLAVTRALYPDLYQGTLAPSAADRLHARTQAMAEITGGAEPVGNDQITRVNRRTREILEEGVNPEVVKEAEEMGDLAAFQNDPKGVMGLFYNVIKGSFGLAERGIEKAADRDGLNPQVRAAMLIIAGNLRAAMGAKFIRFAANWANKQLMAVPGTYLIQKAGVPIFGGDITRTQANYIAGRNVVGLMVMTTLLTYLRGILDKDDDEEGWHLSGNWDDVPKNTQKELMSAGIPRLALWKREGGKITAFTYKNQPLSAMLAALGSLGDEKRYLPEQFKQHGEGGHLLRALAIGAMQIKDLSAVSGLADLLGKSNPNEANAAEGFAERLNRSVARWGTGFIPNVIKDVDAWTDTRFYKPETAAEEWVRGVPIMRRSVAGGRPMLNILGQPVDLKRAPWNRSVQSVETSEAQRVLGALLTRGLSVPLPSDGVTVTRNGKRVALDTLGSETVYRYQKTVGEGYQEWLAKEGAALLTMPVEQAEAIIRRRSDRIRQAALVKVAY